MGRNVTAELREGSLVGFRIRKEEDEIFLNFLEMQSNRTEMLRYLVEKEIVENGLRDLSLTLTVNRDIRRMIIEKHGEKELEKLLSKLEKNQEYPLNKKNEENDYVIPEYNYYVDEEEIKNDNQNVENQEKNKDEIEVNNKQLLNQGISVQDIEQIILKVLQTKNEIAATTNQDLENQTKSTDIIEQEAEERSVLDSDEIDVDKWLNLGK